MTERRWHARIEAEGRTLGAGILVDSTRVLTCAHVVEGFADVRVGFPNAAELGELPARVAFRGPWRRLDDFGDVAVLELGRPVDITPATFTDPSPRHTRERRELTAYGFREGNEIWGSYTRVTVDHHEVMGDWVQVNTVPGHPEPVQQGFSGAAAYDGDTGTVFGMITEADTERPVGRMLPVASIRRHWEELDDLLPLDWLGPADRRALRRIVGEASEAAVMEHVLAALPAPPGRRTITSVWAAIRFVGEECHGEFRLTRFLCALEPHLPADVAERLRDWRRRTLRTPPAQPAPGAVEHRPAMTSVIVRVDRTRAADRYRLTFSTLADGVPRPAGNPVEVRGAANVKRAVEQAMSDLIGTVAGRRPVIEFVLPESWLSKPVDEWKAGVVPMSTYPVVVRDVQRLQPGIRQDQALTRWSELDGRTESKPAGIRCRHPQTADQFSAWLTENDDLCVLAYATQPRQERLQVALNHGIPVLLWPRAHCAADDHGDCAGDRFLEHLAEKIADASPEELPDRVKKLRAQARQVPEHEAHCGRKLTLLWDDPRRHPDRPLYMET